MKAAIATVAPQTAVEGDSITLTLTFKVPRAIQDELQTWVFEYFTNLKIEAISKTSESAYELQAVLQDKIMSAPQLLEDNVRLGEMTKVMQQELLASVQTLEMYRNLNERADKEVDELQKQLVQQSYLVEKLAKENTKYLEDLQSKGDTSMGGLIHAMNSEKDELIAQSRILDRKMQLLEDHMRQDALTPKEEDLQPFV